MASCETRTVNLGWKNLAQALRRETFDLIVAMNVLNEFGDVPSRARLVQSLLQRHLTANGVLILIEPGLQRATRELMELRDLLMGSVHILAPCLHHDACPMLRHSGRDWCHFYLDWDRPKIIADLDRLIGNKKEYLKFSYLILTDDRRQATDEGSYRVVSAPLRSKGKMELLLCPAEGNDTSRLHRITRFDKDRAPANADLDRVTRGDMVTGVTSDRVTQQTPFTIHAPWTTEMPRNVRPSHK